MKCSECLKNVNNNLKNCNICQSYCIISHTEGCLNHKNSCYNNDNNSVDICKNCIKICIDCNNNVCLNCLKDNKCFECEEYFCKECAHFDNLRYYNDGGLFSSNKICYKCENFDDLDSCDICSCSCKRSDSFNCGCYNVICDDCTDPENNCDVYLDKETNNIKCGICDYELD